MKKLIVTISALSISASQIVTPALAQAPRASCPGGEAKLASGKCIDPGLSASLRQRSVLLSQPKISRTAFPIPPTQDRVYPRPNEYDRLEFTFRGLFSTAPFPFSCHPNC